MTDPIRSHHPLQKLYLWLHRKNFQKRLSRKIRFRDKLVVSLGNLSAGGTGKTPLGVRILELALQKGYRPAVVLRGYGGKRSKAGGLVYDGQEFRMPPSESGDEAQLYHIAGIRVIIGSNRSRAIERFAGDCDFIVLDDAFQNPSVHRDVDLVLLDASLDPEDCALIPLGRFREPLSALSRAHALILTRTDLSVQRTQVWKELIQSRFPALPVLQSVHEPAAAQPSLPVGSQVLTVSGIGNPEGFERAVQAMGYEIRERFRYRDHHPYTRKDLRKWQKGWPVITTEKDLVRIRNIAATDAGSHRKGIPVVQGLHYLPIRMSLNMQALENLIFSAGPAKERIP